MAKDKTVRINNTLAFIGNTNAVTDAERNHAHAFATAFIQNRYPAGNAGQPGYDNFSRAMSLGWHLSSDPNHYRQMKRASYLLCEALRDANPATRLPQVAVGNLGNQAAETLFKDLLRKVRIVSDQGAARNGGATAALTEMRLNPERFFATNKVIVLGSPVRDLAQGDRNVLNFCFGYDLGNDRYFFQAGAPAPGSVAVAVDSITAMNWTEVPGSWMPAAPGGSFAQIPGIELASQVMVTTQFTGCAFCMKRQAGSVYCAHLAPTRGADAGAARGLTGNALARELAAGPTAGDFANAPGGDGFAVYGAGFSHNTLQARASGYPDQLGGGGNYMTIVGLQRGLDYEIYSQVTQGHRLMSYERVF
jgi:hypothetical protein